MPGVVVRDGIDQRAGERVDGGVRDVGQLPVVVEQAEAEQALHGRGGIADASGTGSGLQRGQGQRQAAGEQAAGLQRAQLLAAQRVAVGVEGHAPEEGEHGVSLVGSAAGRQFVLDRRRRHAALQVVLDDGKRLAGGLRLAGEHRLAEQRLQSGVAVGQLAGALQQGEVETRDLPRRQVAQQRFPAESVDPRLHRFLSQVAVRPCSVSAVRTLRPASPIWPGRSTGSIPDHIVRKKNCQIFRFIAV